MYIVTKLARVVTYCKELPTRNPSMRWSCELISQIKFITIPFTKDPWTLN